MGTNYAPCPKCEGANAKALNFTWWGGALGPKLMAHVKCLDCGYKYNGKSGKDNATNIIIYFVVVSILAFVLMLVAFAFLARL